MFVTEAAFSSANDSFLAGPQWLRFALSSRVPLRSAQNVSSSTTTYQAEYVGTLLEPYKTSDFFIAAMPHYRTTTDSSPTFGPLPDAPDAVTANIENDYIGTATGSLVNAANWSLGHVPTVSEDAVFTATTGIRALTAANLTVGSFNVTATTGTFSIRNNTTGAGNSVLTLGGPGSTGNSVSGNSADLLYANTGSTFNIIGPNGSTGTGTLSVVLGQSGNINAAGTIAISAGISGSGFGITKTGAGTLTLSGNNTYTGTTTVNAGTLQVSSAPTDQALGGTTGVRVNTGGTLLQTTSNQINNAANMTLDGGRYTLNGGVSEGTTGAPGLGSLTLMSSSIISLVGTDVLHFDNSSLAAWTPGATLSIYNYSGVPVTGGGSEQILFGTDLTGLTAAQLASIQFYTGEGTGAFIMGAAILPTGEIVPVPEMSTWISAALALGFIAFTQRRKLRGLVAGRA
jgi:autotransporter-associated beta strand protein